MLTRSIASGELGRQLKFPARATTPVASATPTSVLVSSCGDGDGDFTTLRHAVLTANSGDTIDLSGLACSKITLQNGAVAVTVDDLTIKGAGAAALTIDGNQADRVFVHSGTGTLTLTDLTIANGAVRAEHAYGGCVLSAGNVTLNHAEVRSCRALGQTLAAGGGVMTASNLTLESSALSGNLAEAAVGMGSHYTSALAGGAVAMGNSGSSIILTNSVVSANTARAASGLAGAGGLVALHVDAKYSTFSGNQAISIGTVYDYSASGAFAAADSLIMSNCTLDHNEADVAGAMLLSGDGVASILQSTISSNTGRLAVGAILSAVPLTLMNSTVAFNYGGSIGGGVSMSGAAELRLYSTIAADNTPADVSNGVTITGSKNVVKIAATEVVMPADTIRLDPQLLPLAYNGGATRTHALAGTSPAIEAGSNPTNRGSDQRGPAYPRIVGAAADIGAYEHDPDRIFDDEFGT